MAVSSTLTKSIAVLSISAEASPDFGKLEGTGEELGKLKAAGDDLDELESTDDVDTGLCDEVEIKDAPVGVPLNE